MNEKYFYVGVLLFTFGLLICGWELSGVYEATQIFNLGFICLLSSWVFVLYATDTPKEQ